MICMELAEAHFGLGFMQIDLHFFEDVRENHFLTFSFTVTSTLEL